MTRRDDLPNDIEVLKALLIAEREKSAAKDARIDYLLEQFRLAQQKQFGQRAEGFSGQGELFNEAEEVVEALEQEKQTVSNTRSQPKRTDSPTPDSPIPNIVLYDYQASRAGSCVVDYLNGYTDYLQVDGYQGYEQTQATLVGCFAHARRKFIEAKSGIKSTNKTQKAGKADMVLSLIQKLYALEHQLKGKTPQKKQQARNEKAKPILDKLNTYLLNNQGKVPPQSLLGKAINYTLKQWSKLTRYLENGLLNIDNNRAERAIKPFVIGRKNWLFSNTTKGAQASATLHSIIETAKANGLTPFDYLKTCLDELCQPNADIEKLLPWNTKQN